MSASYDSFWAFLIGRKTKSIGGSNRRRFYGRISLVFFIFAIVTMLFFSLTVFNKLLAMFYVCWACAYSIICMIVPPLRSSVGFIISPKRLLFNTLISAGQWIMSCAIMFRWLGLRETSDITSEFDYIYFSAVTFATLGIGDFTPLPEARWLVATLALVGNIHLGFVVGAIFSIIQRPNISKNTDQK